MKKQILLFFLFGSQIFNAQTLLLQESFETDGEGTRYTSNSFQTGCSDFFERIQDSDIPGNNCVSNTIDGEDGTFFWGGEDTDQASGGEAILTLNSLAVTGFDLDLDISMAFGRPNDGRCEFTDYFILEYNMDGGGWTPFGALYGNSNVAPFNGNLQVDTNLDGTANAGAQEVNSTTFQNFNFSIPVTGNSVQVRFRILMDQGTEEVLFDNIRINGTTTLGIDDNSLLFNNVLVYPNPNNGLINIDLGDLENASLNIYNTLGQLIYRKENITNSFHQFELDESKGLHFIEISSQNNKQTYKLIIK